MISKFIVEEFDAKLIITGRSSRSPRIESVLEEIGGNVRYLEVNVSNYQILDLKIKEVESEIGKIDGIFHSAGIPDYGGIIQNRNRAQSEEVFEAKIYGTIAINQIAMNRNVDFLILFSSAAAGIAPFGEVAYTSANMFLDNLARSLNNKIVQSIGWDTWSETGMGLRSARNQTDAERKAHVQHGMSNAEGIEVLKRILFYNLPSVAVSTRNIELLYLDSQMEEILESSEPKVIQNRPLLSSEYVPPITETEKTLCIILQEFFGLNELGIKDNLFELGMDSLKAMKIKGYIHQKLNIDLRINDVLENPNVLDLSKKIDSLQTINRMQTDGADMYFEHEIEL